MPTTVDQSSSPTTESAFLRPAQLAALLGVSLATAYRRIEDHTFPAVRVGGLLLVPRQFLENMTAPTS